MTQFPRSLFYAVSAPEREALCSRLAAAISRTLKDAGRFHDSVATVVADLREVGHDLWSYDEEDEFEVWGPNYVQPKGPGIVITFHADGPTEVGWSPT